MTDARTIQIDPRDYRLDARLLRRIWRIAKPYWGNKAHWRSWGLVIFGLLMIPVWAYYNFWATTVGAQQANALVSRNSEEWHALFWLFFMIGVGQWVYTQILSVLNMLLNNHLYRWMTRWVVARYLHHKTYYDIATKDDIDNPDERIQENIMPVMQSVMAIPGMLITPIAGLITSTALMSQVNTGMTLFVVVYSLVSMGLQMLIQWPLIRKNFDAVAAQADFRFGLLRVRDNAETIAFFRGENMEERQVDSRLDRVIKNSMDIYWYSLKTGIVTKVFGEIWALAPLFYIYPLYFSGKIEFGMIALATGAAGQLRTAITSFDDMIPFLAGVAPKVVRLAQIVERFDELDERDKAREGNITIQRGGDRIELRDVSFQTPGGEQQLSQDVSLTIRQGESMIIIGQTGVGKSSMLRSMAGLWLRGTGTMTMPAEDDTMFVPQKPYMMLGNLRAQLLYPHGRSDMTDEELQAVLEKVCLPQLIEKAGGLEANKDWSKVLSLGEQQRVSFARILISRPKFVFLDESTSAVDIPTEAKLYKALIETGATFVSVGHRETILRFHDRALRLLVGGGWEIINSRTIEPTLVQPLGASRGDTADNQATTRSH